MRHDESHPSPDKILLAFTLTNWSEIQNMTTVAGDDANYADDGDRLILIESNGRY